MIRRVYNYLLRRIYCATHSLDYRKLVIVGIPQIVRQKGSQLNLMGKLIVVSDPLQATLGRAERCKLMVYENATLTFRGQCGMSNSVIVASKSISIGNNVMIGGGCTIVDTDFHSMDYHDWFTSNDEKNMQRSPIVIGDNVFIGMDSVILKGVTIGNGAIIAARSVVVKDIPENEVWGGNPAKFIKRRN